MFHFLEINDQCIGHLCLRYEGFDTYPAATPILNITRCQYSVANPVNIPHTLNNIVQIAINFGLEKDYKNMF